MSSQHTASALIFLRWLPIIMISDLKTPDGFTKKPPTESDLSAVLQKRLYGIMVSEGIENANQPFA